MLLPEREMQVQGSLFPDPTLITGGPVVYEKQI